MRHEPTIAILAGGLGTRLRSVLPYLPKPMADINGKPFLEYLLAQVVSSGCRNVVLCVGYKSDVIKKYFGDGKQFGLNIAYSEEETLLGTAGAIVKAKNSINSDPFVVMNGDSFCDINLAALLEYHDYKNAVATIAVVQVSNKQRYGSVEIHFDNEISEFVEKGNVPQPGLINSGIYVINRPVLDSYPVEKYLSMERDVLPSLIGAGLYAYKTSGVFIDIGIPSELVRAQILLRKLNLLRSKTDD